MFTEILQFNNIFSYNAFLILLGLILLYQLVIFIRNYIIFSKYPSPPCLPIIGHFPEIIKTTDKVFNFLRECAKDHTYYILTAFGYNALNIYQPEDVEVITSSLKHSSKSRVYRVINLWLKEGLLTSSGRKWHNRRKILTPSFHFNILQQFLNTFVEQGQRLVDELKPECDKPYINLDPFITDCTLHTILETAMGSTLNIDNAYHNEYRKLVYKMGELAVYKLARPWLTSPLAWLYPKHWEQLFIARKLHKFTKQVIAEREKNFKPSEMPKDEDEYLMRKRKNLAMLDVLLLAKHNGQIDNKGILEEVDTFTFEGHDTTAMNIVFTLMLLANHKEIQDKVVQEIMEIVGPTRRPTYEDLQNLKYLENCIKESLRMYPSVHFISRETSETIQFRKHILPKGTMIFLHIYDLHRNPSIYHEPNKFDPDRFLPENSVKRHPFAYIPFSAGPRNCIGQKFAMLEVKTVLLYLLREFEFLPVDTPDSLNLCIDIILRAVTPVKIRLQPRILNKT